MRNWKNAALAGRELVAEDYEPLIDSEGPVVRWPNGRVEWYPGQSMGFIAVLPPVSSVMQMHHRKMKEIKERRSDQL
jgi:hypothetical protein